VVPNGYVILLKVKAAGKAKVYTPSSVVGEAITVPDVLISTNGKPALLFIVYGPLAGSVPVPVEVRFSGLPEHTGFGEADAVAVGTELTTGVKEADEEQPATVTVAV